MKYFLIQSLVEQIKIDVFLNAEKIVESVKHKCWCLVSEHKLHRVVLLEILLLFMYITGWFLNLTF